MTSIATRLDEETKAKAEKIASQLGMPLSTVINVFIRQFVRCKGFPFDLRIAEETPYLNERQTDAAVRDAVKSSENGEKAQDFVYMDPKTKKLVKVHGEG